MKKLICITFTLIFIISCKDEKSFNENNKGESTTDGKQKETMSQLSIHKVITIVENEEKDSLQNKNTNQLESYQKEQLNSAEANLAKCYRQCRKTYKDVKPPLKISIDEADLEKFKIPKIEYDRKSITDSDILYNAFITVAKAYCIDGCIFDIPVGDKIREEYDKFNDAYTKLVNAKKEIEIAKQNEKKAEKKN